METKMLTEILEYLDSERRLIHYYKDLYAIYLLHSSLESSKNKKLSTVRQSRFGKLLERPIVKEIAASCGGGELASDKLENYYSENYQSFVLTLSEWGSIEDYHWAQTSRPGKNLVLQLNFTGEHDKLMEELGVASEAFEYGSHPISKHKNSIAWARIDLDLETGEALIEEIQNDWLREAKIHNQIACCSLKRGQDRYGRYGLDYNASKMVQYTDEVLSKYMKTWSEVMLFTAIKFIREELSIKQIYYHSVETAKVLKKLDYSFPPISLYTDLPRKFCFLPKANGPEFLVKEKTIKRRIKKISRHNWFYLQL